MKEVRCNVKTGQGKVTLKKKEEPGKWNDVEKLTYRQWQIVWQYLIRNFNSLINSQVNTPNFEVHPVHVKEIKEYLKALDLVVDCPRRSISTNDEEEYVFFTQPGMRYCQAQSLVHVLMKDKTFQAYDQDEQKMACEKILEDVRGRMMEDIVLLDTTRFLPKKRSTFKLTLDRSEFDMVIYDSEENTCEAYEIKHSSKIVPRQYHVLEDNEQCELVEKQYGKITRRCVIYRGKSTVLDNGIEYLNVEEYLKSL